MAVYFCPVNYYVCTQIEEYIYSYGITPILLLHIWIWIWFNDIWLIIYIYAFWERSACKVRHLQPTSMLFQIWQTTKRQDKSIKQLYYYFPHDGNNFDKKFNIGEYLRTPSPVLEITFQLEMILWTVGKTICCWYSIQKGF